MPHEPVRLKDTKGWLEIAAKDLRRAELMMTATPDFEASLYFCQQSAEKSLKAFLVWHNVAFRRVHDLEEIGRQCLSVDQDLTALIVSAQSLTAYASRFRYPGAPYVPDVDEVESAIATAREVFSAVVARLPADAHPLASSARPLPRPLES
jgi:HEPN domain-containing protein